MEYKFIITALDVQAKKEDAENVVVSVHWRYQSTTDSSISVCGSETFETIDKSNFINYSDLTENDVILWLEKSIDMVELQGKIDSQLVKSEIVTNYYPFQKPMSVELEAPVVAPIDITTPTIDIVKPTIDIVKPTIDIATPVIDMPVIEPIQIPTIDVTPIEIPRIEITPIEMPEPIVRTFDMPKP